MVVAFLHLLCLFVYEHVSISSKMLWVCMTLGCHWPLVGGEQPLCELICSACVPWQAQLWDRELSVSGYVCWNSL